MTGLETASLVIAGANAAATIIVAIGIRDGVRKLNQQTKESAERRRRREEAFHLSRRVRGFSVHNPCRVEGHH